MLDLPHAKRLPEGLVQACVSARTQDIWFGHYGEAIMEPILCASSILGSGPSGARRSSRRPERGDAQGKYQVTARSSRGFWKADAAVAFQRRQTLVSNPMDLEIVPADGQWQKEQL